jgi:hypothetical protein
MFEVCHEFHIIPHNQICSNLFVMFCTCMSKKKIKLYIVYGMSMVMNVVLCVAYFSMILVPCLV